MSDTTTLQKPSSALLPFRINERYYAPILISLILIVGQVSFHFLTSPTGTAIGIISSILTELLMGFLFYRKLPNFASAYVSGISVGILVQSTMVWPYVLCCIIAILSKYCIRIDKRHLWNPSNLGIVTLLLVAPRYVSTLGAQAGNSMFAMTIIWIVGSIIVYRIKRLHICLTYVFFFLLYAAFRSLILSHYVANESFLQEAAPITGPMYQLFIFFMITDPKNYGTFTKRPNAGCVSCREHREYFQDVWYTRFTPRWHIRKYRRNPCSIFRFDIDGTFSKFY